MNKYFKTILIAGLCLLVIFALCACKNNNDTEESEGTTLADSASEPEEPTTAETATDVPSESMSDSVTEPIDEGLYEKLVVLGDSISTGYGLSGYKKGSSNSGVASFANKVAAENKLKYGKNYFNYAVDGYKSYDVLQSIDSRASAVMSADLVLISMGGNDVMYPMVEGLADVSGISLSSVSEGVQFILGFMKASEEETIAFKANFEKKGADLDAMLTGLINNYAENLEKIIRSVRELSPDAEIVIQTVYNPIDDDNIIKNELMKFVNENVAGKYIGMLNEVIKNKAESLNYTVVDIASLFAGKGVIYTNISNNDIHPNTFGHKAIAEAIISATKKNTD